MSVAITIGGVTKHYRVGTLSIQSAAKERSTASFSIRSNDASYRPALGDEVIITENGTRIFGGVIDRPVEAGVLGDGTGAYAAITTQVSAADFNQYAERRVIVDGGFPAGYTLLQALTALVAWFTDFGVTLDGAQVTGPTLPEMVYKYMTLTEVLNELATLTGNYGDPFVWEIDHFKVLRMYQPSTSAAPFDITEGDGTTIGDVTVQQSRDKYANRIFLKVPSKSETARIEAFTGDGSTTAFPLQYTLTKPYGYVTSAGVFETLNYTGDADAATWTYDKTTNTITRNSGAPALSDTIDFKFDGTYDGSATAEDAGEIASEKIWERIVPRDDVPDSTTAQALADAALAEALSIPKTIKYRTFQAGIKPGQTQHITMAMRDLDDDAVVTDVTIADYGAGGGRLVRSVTLTSGAIVQEGWRQGVRDMFSDKSGASTAGGTTVGAGVPVSAGPAPPDTSVQFNTAGKFDGKSTYTFRKAQNSIVVGDLSSITAATFESCQAFGYDCHIADP